MIRKYNSATYIQHHCAKRDLTPVCYGRGRITGIDAAGIFSRSLAWNHENTIGSISDWQDSLKNQSFTYDGLGRLKDSSGVYGAIYYDYDLNGNRMSRSDNVSSEIYGYEYGTNRLSDISASLLSRDSAGNLTGKGNLSYHYAANNCMTEVKDATTGQLLKSYVYNGKGEQVMQSSDDIRKFVLFGPDFLPIGYFEQPYLKHTYFLYGPGGQLLGEYGDNGSSEKEYAYGPTGRVAEFDSGGMIYLHINDHLGTPQVITDMNLTPVWKADYKPFGEVIEDRDPDGNGVLFTNNLRFPGQRWDEVAQLSYNYFRNYDPTTGRYTQHDPIGLNGGMNPFAYVDGNPMLFTDPNGLIKWKGYVKSVGASLGGGAMRFEFELTSDCVNGKKAHMVVVAGGFALGVGVKGASGVSPIEFDDGYKDFNPSAYEGTAYYFSAGAGISLIGINASAFRLGDVSIGGVSPFVGFDLSVGLGAGTSFVESFNVQ